MPEALATASRALELSHGIGPYWWEAEICRVQGELMLADSADQAESAQACFAQALAVARRQSAKSLELRAAMSQARLARQRGRPGQTVVELESAYEWFSEGLDSADLMQARELLNELR